jgi:hypothetical protein
MHAVSVAMRKPLTGAAYSGVALAGPDVAGQSVRLKSGSYLPGTRLKKQGKTGIQRLPPLPYHHVSIPRAELENENKITA